MGERLVAQAEIEEGMIVLEPSAGNGALAGLISKLSRDLTLVELSPLRAKILQKRFGENVYCGDFMQWQNPHGFDRIVMNPPFSGGQAAAHIAQAVKLLNRGGKLVSIVPASFSADVGAQYTLSEVIANAFTGTAVNVRILEINKPN